MPQQTHEQTINVALGELLEDLGHTWIVRSEPVGQIFQEGGRPDILIEKSDGWPIVIEAEVNNPAQAEMEARSRLGRHLSSTGTPIHASVALVYPLELRNFSGASLRSALGNATFRYALFAQQADSSASRIPTGGWIEGGLKELAFLIHRSSIPAWQVEALADELERGVTNAEALFSNAHAHGSALGETIASLLGQVDDERGQTRRMAMTVVADALVFHAALAEAELEVVASDGPRPVRTPTFARENGAFRPSVLCDEWQLILGVNYWPIFHTASAIVAALPTQTASRVLGALWDTSERLVVGGVTRSHDLTGVVFQRLIADRKFLATYYTMPSAAALLVGLALPFDETFGVDWGSPESVGQLKIGDFACGTGTLLSTAYQRVGLLHELEGGDARAIHADMMAHGLVGLDVLTVAVHLTAAMLAGSYPDTPFAGECLLTMPYGTHQWGTSVGSLDLLESQPSFEILQAAATTAGGRGAEEVNDLYQRVGHAQFDLLIMNPPFTRHGAREGERIEVHNPAFAAFGATDEEQTRLAGQLQKLSKGGIAHGHAGLASYFVDLADRKLKGGGRLALVLPLSSMSGTSWRKVRERWSTAYRDLLVVTIAGAGSFDRSFSADTGMAECLVIGTKDIKLGEKRISCAVIQKQPGDSLRGALLAQSITATLASGLVARLEDGPFGGSPILIGNEEVGQVLDCPVQSGEPWQTVGINDLTLAQTAYQLSRGSIWIAGMAASEAVAVPVDKIASVIERVGPHHLDLTGAAIKQDGLPQGPFEKIAGTPPAGSPYPSLWNHDASRERRMQVQPDSYCRLRRVGGTVPTGVQNRAASRFETATRAHYNTDLQFNSQSTILAMTPEPAIGGRAWPSLVLSDREHEFALALWCNSTLGLMCHWWMSNKSQSGRGIVTVQSVLDIPVLDLSALSASQHASAREQFDALSNEQLLPFDQIDEDDARAKIDTALLINVLGLPAAICEDGGPIERLRRKLAAEPQIHGGKATRVVFGPNGEATSPRSDRA